MLRGCSLAPLAWALCLLLLLRPWPSSSLSVPPAEDPDAAASADDDGLGPAAVEVLSADTLESLVTRRCSGPVAVAFHGGRLPPGVTNGVDRHALDELQAAAVEVDQMACFGTVSCDAFPDLCDLMNVAVTPSMLMFSRTPSLQVKDFVGDWSKAVILTAIIKLIKAASRGIKQVSADNLGAYLQDRARPLKVLLFTSRKVTPVLLEALDGDQHLWAHIRFGVAKHTDKELTAAFQVTEVPRLVLISDTAHLPNGDSTHTQTHVHYIGQTLNFMSLRGWLRERVAEHLASGILALNSSITSEDDEAMQLAGAISEGTALVARFAATVFRDAGSLEPLRLVKGGAALIAAGPVQRAAGFDWVPVEPSGAVELGAVALLQDAPPYQKLPYGTKGCPEGLQIESAEECEKAIVALGLLTKPSWISNFPGLPSYCSIREDSGKDRMHFNSAKGGASREDLAPVCRVPEEAAAPTASGGTTLAKARAEFAKRDAAREAAKAAGTALVDALADDNGKTKGAAAKKDKLREAMSAGIDIGETLERVRKGASKDVEELEEQLNNQVRPVREKAKAREAKKAELARKSDYQQSAYGEEGCPPGLEILSVDECERAILSLGIVARPAWTSSFPELPAKCSVRETTAKGSPERMHFNSVTKGVARADLAPICKKPQHERSGDAAGDTAAASSAAAAAVAEEEQHEATLPFLIPELMGSTQEELFGGTVAFIYLREGPITALESIALMVLSERLRPRWEEKGLDIRWMWLDVQQERKLKAVFDPPILPSAVLLEWKPFGEDSAHPGFATVAHREEDGDPQPVFAGEEIELLLNTYLGGDAKFAPISMKRLQVWATRRPGA